MLKLMRRRYRFYNPLCKYFVSIHIYIHDGISAILKEKHMSEYCCFETNFGCNYRFPIHLAPNGIPIGAKSIGKV